MYNVEISSKAKRELKGLAGENYTIFERVRSAILELGSNSTPHGVKKLRGYPNYYRIRVGDYRIIYSIEHQILKIEIIRVGHRRDVYR